jgi:hypothetical protein
VVFAIGTQTKHKMTARIGRTIFAVLIGLSVATLPTAAGFTAGVPTSAATEVSASDCDHHHSPRSDTTQKGADGCMAACALNCFNFTATSFSGIVFSPPVSAALKLVRTRVNVDSRSASPPFRPPRA